MLYRYFRRHPHSVGETYLQHLHAATWFAFTMVAAGFACFVHALVPGLFVKTGSKAIERLHERMVVNRARSLSIADDASPPVQF